MNRNPSKLERTLGYRFKDEALLHRALTHSSVANERNTSLRTNNEQLEFLGDSIIGFLISDFLYQKFHHLSEEAFEDLAYLVSSANFFKIASRRIG
jgi:ribonuclease-3